MEVTIIPFNVSEDTSYGQRTKETFKMPAKIVTGKLCYLFSIFLFITRDKWTTLFAMLALSLLGLVCYVMINPFLILEMGDIKILMSIRSRYAKARYITIFITV